jgi:hypothetical protein
MTHRTFSFSSRHQCHFKYIDLGRTGQTSRSEALQQWKDLLDDGWIDKQTRNVKIELTSFNGNMGLFAVQTFDFYIERGGRVVLDRDLTAVTIGGKIIFSFYHMTEYSIQFNGAIK